MRLTPREIDRLLLFQAAQLARLRRAEPFDHPVKPPDFSLG